MIKGGAMEFNRRDFIRLMTSLGLGFSLGNPLLQGCDSGDHNLDKSIMKGQSKMGRGKFNKVIVLGIDGLDPKILESMMKKGALPQFSKLAAQGFYSRLGTSIPPQSPVAWSSIATGGNPGQSDVFDFISRNPKNYLPDLAILKTNPKNFLGSKGSMFLPVRNGTAFWEVVAQSGIPSTVVRWPITFPPKNGKSRILSGLGVPDIKGGLGRYTFYTTKEVPEGEEGRDKVVKVVVSGGKIKTRIFGPLIAKLKGRKPSEIPMDIHIDSSAKKIDVQADGRSYPVKEGEWSNWIHLTFDIGFLKKVRGLCKFFLVGTQPEFKLYLTPIQVDPTDPCFPISEPDDYATEMARQIGDYYTLGMPEDTKALTENRINEEAFLGMCDEIVREQEKMLRVELQRLKDGLLSFVFFTTDRIQHIFWITKDPRHSLYTKSYAEKFGHVIDDYYRRMDRILGEVLQHVDNKTALIVCSDHGFTSYRRSVHLNRWFIENGLMVLKEKIDPNDREGGALFRLVDWDLTKAYALGFGSIYLNLKGREGRGMVEPGSEADALVKTIKDELVKFKDPKTGESVIWRVYENREIYDGPYVEKGPDLVVGFRPGYRMSWQTAIGGTPEKLVEDNLKKWTGDHCVDPAAVPGILLMNQKIEARSPGLMDIAPTVLKCFNIRKLKNMGGDRLL
jgi:predicted AlkP superfamily phosphohydrolase/phosphomutase